MKIILISGRHGASRSVELGRWSRALLSLCCLGLPLGLIATGYIFGQDSEARTVNGASLDALENELAQQSGDFAELRDITDQQLQAMTLSLAEMQARVTRLDALGEHLTVMADLAEGEFDFSQPPALGGPMPGEFNVDFSSHTLEDELARFEAHLADRERQLSVLESLLTNRQLQEQRSLTGSPVTKGWISSDYGLRTDPFTGRRAMHTGVDFAGREGAEVVAVAGGVVTWTGEENGYGNMVEISHGDGYVTRYAHNKTNLVAPGDVVRKGEPVALMGSTGRSTGTHVHYEVYKHGRPVDPSSYIARTRR